MGTIIKQIKDNTYIEGSSDKLKHWLREYNINFVPKKSKTSYDGYLSNHIEKTIGEIQLKKLTTVDIQEKLIDVKMVEGRADNKEGGLDSKTIINIATYLSGALSKAIIKKHISTNPCHDLTLPEVEEVKIEALKDDETKLIYGAFKNTTFRRRRGISLNKLYYHSYV